MIEEVVRDVDKIVNSNLYKDQKLRAIKTFILPRLTFAFRTREIKKKALISSVDKETHSRSNPSTKLRKLFRKILSLPHQSESCYLYVSTNHGGAGLVDLYDEYHIQQLVQAFRLLNSPDPTIADITKSSLVTTTCPRLKLNEPSLNRSLDWINGYEDSTPNNQSKKTWWIRVRKAISFLKTTHKISITYESSINGLILRITDAMQKTTVVENCHRKQLTKILHQTLQTSYLRAWSESKISYLVCETVSICKIVNQMIYKGECGSFAWEFIHKARTNTIPINARPMIKDSTKRKCRRCHSSEETLTHALQACVSNLSLINARHNACLQILYEAIKNLDLIIMVDETNPLLSEFESVSKMRIDLYIENVSEKTIHLIDVKCPIDMSGTFESSNLKNLQHYSEYCQKIREVKPKYSVELKTLIIGSLGSIPSETFTIIRKLGISEIKLKQIAKSLAITAIQHSAKIWHYHSSGILLNLVQKT